MKVQEIARREGMLWGDEVSDTYFRDAENDIDYHWDSIIAPVLDRINYAAVVDIAAGRGRNSVKLAQRADKVICVDINADNVRYMKWRFRGDSRFEVILNDGISLKGVDDTSLDLAYSFDSMVHFDIKIIMAYLDECIRVLRPKGHAFVHYSNLTSNPGGNFRENPHWRNYMGVSLLTHIACCAGFSIVSNYAIPWAGVADLDGVALLQKD